MVRTLYLGSRALRGPFFCAALGAKDLSAAGRLTANAQGAGRRGAGVQDLQATDRLAGAQDLQAIDRLAGAQTYRPAGLLAGAQDRRPGIAGLDICTCFLFPI